MKFARPFAILCLAILAWSLPDFAAAACSSPAANVGALDFQGGSFKYCDGSNWQSLGTSYTVPNSWSMVYGPSTGTGITGMYVTAIGNQSGSALTSGASNTFLGGITGYGVTTGSQNTFVGAISGYNAGSLTSHVTSLGYNSARDVTGSINNSTYAGSAAGNGGFGTNGIVIGYNSKTAGNYAIAIGIGVTANTNTTVIGTSGQTATTVLHGNVGIGTTTPAYKLEVAGTITSSSGGFRFPDGTTQTTAVAGPFAKFRVHRNNSTQSITNAGVTLNWTTEDFDTANAFDLTNDEFSPTVAGYYQLHFSYRIDMAGFADGGVATIRKNGSAIATSSASVDVDLDIASVSVSTVVYLNGAGDVVTAFASQTGGTSKNLRAAPAESFFEGFQLP